MKWSFAGTNPDNYILVSLLCLRVTRHYRGRNPDWEKPADSLLTGYLKQARTQNARWHFLLHSIHVKAIKKEHLFVFSSFPGSRQQPGHCFLSYMLRITPLMHLLQVFLCLLHPWLAFRAAWEQKKRCSYGGATPSNNDSDNKSLCLPFGALSVSSPAPISTVELLFADLREGRWHLTGWLCHRPTRFVQQAANVTASHFQVLLSSRRQIYPRLFHTCPTVSGSFRQVTVPNSSWLVQVWCTGGWGTSNQPEEESWDSFDFKEVKLPDLKTDK